MNKHTAPALVTDAPAPIRVPIRPEQAAIITRDHQEMEAVVARVRAEFLRGLEPLSAGQVQKGAAFMGIEMGDDGAPCLVFEAPPVAAA